MLFEDFQHRFSIGLGPCERTVDAFGREKKRATQMKRCKFFQQLAPQGGDILQWNKAVKSGDYVTHRLFITEKQVVR